MYILYRMESGCLSQRDPCHLFAPHQAPPCLPLPRPPMSAVETISMGTYISGNYISGNYISGNYIYVNYISGN